MNRRLVSSIHRWFWTTLIVVAGLCGCRDRPPDYTSALSPAPPLRDRQSVVKHLPEGTSLKSPIIADRILGGNTKTVGDALGRLQVIARDGALYDGIGREIKFHSVSKAKAKDKESERALARLRAKYCVLLLAE